MSAVRRFLLKATVTPERMRRVVAKAVSVFLQWAAATKAWDTVAGLPRWLRMLADFIDRFNAADIGDERDSLIAGLVGYAVTDEAVMRLIDTVSALEADRLPDGVTFLSRPELIRAIKYGK